MTFVLFQPPVRSSQISRMPPSGGAFAAREPKVAQLPNRRQPGRNPEIQPRSRSMSAAPCWRQSGLQFNDGRMLGSLEPVMNFEERHVSPDCSKPA